MIASLVAFAAAPACRAAEVVAASETRAYQADDAHTGRLVGTRVGSSLTPAWALDTGYLVVTPLISNGVVYVTTHRTDDWRQPTEVTALDVATGGRLWTTPLPTSTTGGARTYLASDGAHVYAVVYDAVYALEASTGAVAWHANVGQWDPMPPIVHSGTLIVESAGYGSTLFAFRGSDGALLWQTGGGSGPPVVAGRLAFMAGDCGWRVGVDLATGTRAYVVGGSCYGGAESPAAFDGRYVWAATPDATDPTGIVYDPVDGTSIATFVGQPPAIAAPFAYSARVDHMRALDLQTRAVAWDTALDGRVVTAPLVVDEQVAVRTHDSVYLLDRTTGAVTWRQPVTHQESQYLTTGSRVGLAAGDGYLVVPTKERIEVFRGDGRDAPPPVVATAPPAGRAGQGPGTPPPSASSAAAGSTQRCARRIVHLPRRLARASVRAQHRRLAVRRRHGRLQVTVPPAVATRGVAHLLITGWTHRGHAMRLRRNVRVCDGAQ